MRHSTWGRVLVLASLVLGWLMLAVNSADAVEEAQDFLDRLRERNYYDMALEYLEQLKTSPLCPEGMKEKLDYEIGVTLIGSVRTIGTPEKREETLALARQHLEKFIKEHPDHLLAGSAGSQCANVMVERGRIKVETANKPNTSPENKKKLIEEARALYLEAEKVFEKTERFWYNEAKQYEGKTLDPREDASEIEKRDEARRELVQARLFLAQVAYEIGKTYDPKSKERQEWLGKAAEKYKDLYSKYGQLIAGLYAHMWEGRIYKELNQTDKAVAALKEMQILPDEPEAFRNLKLESLALLVETYFDAKKYKEALFEVEKWEQEARAGDESTEHGLKIHHLAGQAALALAKTLKEGDPEIRKLQAAARKHFDYVARFPGELQRDARLKAAELAGDTSVFEGEPTDYADAKERGDFQWQNMVIAIGKLEQAKTKAEQAKVKEELNKAVADALKYYRMALEMKTGEVHLDDVNLIRFRMAFLYWMAEDLYRAAILGEFLATRYPTHAGARKSAEIAVKAYRKLFTESLKNKEDTTLETEQMTRMALYVAERWPDEPEAEEAWTMLIDTAVDNRDVAKAMEYLEKIPKDSPKRTQAELRTGEALWRAYVQATGLEGPDRPPQEELDKMVQQAQAILEEGIARAKKAVEEGGQVDYSLAYCVLSLVNIYNGTGQPEKAVAYLEDPKLGPMTLLKANHPVLEGHDLFKESVFNAALQAYVGVQQLEKAEAAMNALEASVGQDAEAGKNLTQIYIRLGKQLEETLTRLRHEGKKDEAQKVARGFETFLKRIADRKEGNTFGSLYWVAETFFSMGTAAEMGGKDSAEEAVGYYKSSAKTYLEILKRIKADPAFAPPGSEAAMKVRLAACLRELGDFENSLKLLVAMLKEKENRLDIQREAAITYQEWGAAKAEHYEHAIKGGHPEGGRYLIWGWGGIARRVMPFMDSKPRYEALFFEARYNLAKCRLELALAQRGSEKAATLAQAEKDITIIFRLYPSMGGADWYQKFDDLLKTIQKLRNVKADGLKGLERELAQTTPSSARAASK